MRHLRVTRVGSSVGVLLPEREDLHWSGPDRDHAVLRRPSADIAADFTPEQRRDVTILSAANPRNQPNPLPVTCPVCPVYFADG